MKRSAFRTTVLLGSMSIFAAACNESPSPVESRTPVPGPTMAVFDGTDLTPDVINGGQWSPAYDPGNSVGTGVIRPFLDMQAPGGESTQSGFNTDNDAFVYDQHRTTDTNALPLNYVPILIDPDFPGGSAAAREFVLDGHESDNYFVVDEFEVWICDVAAAATYSTREQFSVGNANCKPVYSIAGHTLDATDQYSSGSGNVFDYRILIPETLFQAAAALLPTPGLCAYNPTPEGTAACGKYLVVWSSMSGVGSTFEEFSTILRPVPGTLQLVKRVVNDHGGDATVADFSLTTDAGALVFDAGVADGANTIKYTSQAIPVIAGPYTFSEANVGGYTEGTWSCTGATATGTAYNAGAVTIADEETVVCTITNDDDPGSLQLVKRVVNDEGGDADVDDFNITTDAGALVWGGGAADGANTLKYTAGALSVSAGSYTLREDDIAGYTEGTWSCTGATPSDNTISAGAVTVANGATVVCTITNDDSPGSLQLIKRVVNDNGGDATVAAFGVATTAGALVFDGGVADGASTIKYTATALPVAAGSYTLRENDIGGYTEGTWSCTGATPSDNTISAGAVTVPNGGSVVCTITNDDIAPSLTLDKITSYSYGGSRPESDWTLTANGGAAGMLSGAGAAGSADVVSNASFKAGTYALSETGSFAGYQNGASFSCVKNGGAAVPGNSIVLAVGDVAVCSITNTDLPGSITVVKNVAGAGSTFNFNTTGTGLNNFSLSPASNDTDSETFNGLSMGQYTVMEVLAAGYTLTGLECTTGGTTDYPGGSTATINLPLGGSVTCTFENTYNTLVTRTQGFWSTHLWIAEAVWLGGEVGGNIFPGMSEADRTLCGVVLDIDDVMGGFWANIARTTTNSRRSALDQARMRLLQQLLAAMLNQAAFGSAPGGAISIDDAKAAFCGDDINAINAAMSAMASFNESGDSELFTPGVSANAKDARALADRAFWNSLPPTP